MHGERGSIGVHVRWHESVKVIVRVCNRVRSVTEHKKGREGEHKSEMECKSIRE